MRRCRTNGWRLALGAAVLGIASPCAAREGETIVYRIRAGDTLYSLGESLVAGRSGVHQIARLNHIRDIALIYAQAPLRIPRSALRDVETPAQVEAFSGQVTASGPGEARALRRGDLLGEGTTIATGRNSFVTLRLSDRSTVALPSQSSVRILRLRRIVLTGTVEREFQIQNGRAKARVTPMPDAGSTFRINTPVSHAAVRGTVFRSAYDEATGIALTEVDEGKVAVLALGDAPGAERLVMPRHGTAVGAALGAAVTPLLEPPALTDAGRPQTGELLQFALAPVPGAQRYRIEIARDAGLLDAVAEDTSDRPAFALPSLPAGTYFARVAGIDARGLEGTSRIYAFERRRNSLTGALRQSGSGGRGRYQFKWDAQADGDPVFRFQLRQDGAARPLVDEAGLKETELVVTNLAPGHYSWRVQSLIPGDQQVIATWMPEQAFEVARRR
ncbi:MAG: FecR domain-containing protein [Novosphingobium sp.]